MKSKSKALLAVFAVTLMLGCALVPIFSDDTKQVEAEDANADGTEGFSISEILGFLLNADYGASNEMDHFFMPVETPEGPIEPLYTEVVGPVIVGSGQVVGLKGDYVFEPNADGNKGSITIAYGATLAFDPTEDIGFSLTNNNNEQSNLIFLEQGAMISVFGMTFELLGSSPLVIINMSASTDQDIAKCSFTFERNVSGHSEFRVNASQGLNLTFADLLTFDVDVPGGRDVIVVSGNFAQASSGIGFAFSGSVSLHEISSEERWLSYPNYLTFSVNNLSFSYVLKEKGADVRFSASVSTDCSMRLFNNRLTLVGFALDVKDVSIGMVSPDEGNTLELELHSPGSIVLHFVNCSWRDKVGDFAYGLDSKDFNIGFDVSGYSSKFVLNGGSGASNEMVVEGGISLTCVETSVQVSYKTFSANLMFTGNVNVDSIHYGYGSDGYNLTIGKVSSSGVTSSMELRYTLLKSIVSKIGITNASVFVELQYGIESDTNVTDISISSENGITSFGFDKLRSDLRVVRGSPNWNGEVLISGLSVTTKNVKTDEGDVVTLQSAKVDRVYVRNDLPMQQVLSGLQYTIVPNVDIGLDPKDVCIPTIGVELTDVVYEAPKSSEEPKKIGARYVRIDVKEYRDIEEFSIEFSENVMMTFGTGNDDEKSSIMFDSSGVSGSVKNTDGERNGFSITSSPKVALKMYYALNIPSEIPPIPSIDEILKIGVSLDIRNGIAGFDGGVLPFGIEAGNGTTFDANGLMAAGFVFDKGCNMSGTVAIDTDADLSIFYDKAHRVIRIGEDYALIPGNDGYAIALDISKRTEGTLVANQGSKLPASFEMDGFSMRSADNRTGTFTVGPNGATVRLQCDRESYNLTYEGVLEPIPTKCGSAVTLSANCPQKPGLDFYGWNDGTTIHRPFDTFIMPSHDVILKPVFIKVSNGVKVVEGNKTVIVVEAPEADLVRVNVADINIINLDWDVMRVTVGNTTFEIDELVFEVNCCKSGKEGKNNPGTHIRPIVFQSTTVGTDGGKMCCDLRVYMVEKDATYKEITMSFPIVNYENDQRLIVNTVFGTTVNMKADGNVKGFNVYEVDYKGNLVAIDGVTFVKCGEDSYDVSFAINHAAQYVVEPVYDGASQLGHDNIMTAVIGIAVVLTCAIGIGYVWARRS